MKSRVLKIGNFWFGEVYADWVFGGEGWRSVTSPCFTRLGATVALKHWISQHKIYEVN